MNKIKELLKKWFPKKSEELVSLKKENTELKQNLDFARTIAEKRGSKLDEMQLQIFGYTNRYDNDRKLVLSCVKELRAMSVAMPGEGAKKTFHRAKQFIAARMLDLEKVTDADLREDVYFIKESIMLLDEKFNTYAKRVIDRCWEIEKRLKKK